MKVKEKQEAIRLRKEEGLSLREISRKLNISKGSVSLWVRNIELTEEQKEKLHPIKLVNDQMDKAREVGIKNAKNKRIEYQKEGREKLINLQGEQKDLFISGCMLYWGEGTKKNNKNSVALSNSDAKMLKFFILFLKKCFNLENKDIDLYIHCYDDIHSVSEIENYWLENLKLDKFCLRKTMINKISPYSQSKRCGLLEWGTCKIVVNSTRILQQIYGAIQKIANFENHTWLTGISK